MLQEIKYQLFKLFLTQKKKLVLLACLVFFGLFAVSQITHAFALDLASVQLDALDFIDNSVLKWLVLLFLLAVESVTLLNISANLLDWSSALPVGLDNLLVKTGWNFTSGLANLSFILIFIVIVLAYILQLDTFEMKKALPRLIIIALLINFSLLFVQMLTDAGWIFQNSFRSVFFEGGGLATVAIESLKTSSSNLITTVGGILLGYLAVSWIPYVNVIALAGIGTMVWAGGGGALLGLISQTILVIIFNFIVGFIFLVFAALFLVRIAIIWLLAIFAPLAFMAYILPGTQKYFKQWFDTLVQWLIFGIIAFFLMGLGIKLFGVLDIGAGQETIFPGQLGNWTFFDTFYKYIFLLIYLIVVLGFCKKIIPAGTEAVWNAVAKGSTAVGIATGLSPLGVLKTAAKASQAYRLARQTGFSRGDALGEAGVVVKRWIRPRRPGSTREATWGEVARSAPRAAARGTMNTIRGVAKAGAYSALGIKTSKKGKKECPNCHRMIAANAKSCPNPDCGYNFEP